MTAAERRERAAEILAHGMVRLFASRDSNGVERRDGRDRGQAARSAAHPMVVHLDPRRGRRAP